MIFEFKSEGKILYGLPFVAKISLGDDNELKKDYFNFEIETNNEGEVFVKGEYEAENYDIVEIRLGCHVMEELPLYYLCYRNKLIDLGIIQDEKLETRIKLYLDNSMTICELLEEVNEITREEYAEEIEQIFNEQRGKSRIKREVSNKILEDIKEFVHGREWVNIQFNDYHAIINSTHEKINICQLFGDIAYIETERIKLSIQKNKIINYDILTESGSIVKIELDMEGNTKILLQ